MSWELSDEVIVIGMVFIAAFLLVQSFMVPTFGENRQARKRLRNRLRTMTDDGAGAPAVSLVRRKYLRELSPVERWLEALPGVERLEHLVEQAGRETPAYRIVLLGLALGAAVGLAFAYLTASVPVAVGAGLLAAVAPVVKLSVERRQRLARFEEQLPDALTIMARALRAGHPFTGALHLVGEELQPPVSREFATTFTEINYGGDVRTALGGLLDRVPSVTVMAFVSSVLIQRETGGNLAELLDQLSAVVRGRFRFHRKLRTLSAEGKMAAWILSLMPFGLAGVLSLINPDFIPMLTQDPTGRQLVVVAFVLMIAGILWLRRIVRIDV